MVQKSGFCVINALMNFRKISQFQFDGLHKNTSLNECDEAWAKALLRTCAEKHRALKNTRKRIADGKHAETVAMLRYESLGRTLPGHYNKAECQAVYAEAKRLEREDGIPRHVDHIIPLQGRDENGNELCGLHVAYNLQIVTAAENLKKGRYVEAKHVHKKTYPNSEFVKCGINARFALRRGYVMPGWADFEEIRAIYAEARRLTRETGIRYEVDHIVSLVEKNESGEHIACGLHTPDNLRIVPRAENRAKGCYSGRV